MEMDDWDEEFNRILPTSDNALSEYESCIAELPYVELWAQSLTGECDALVGSYCQTTVP